MFLYDYMPFGPQRKFRVSWMCIILRPCLFFFSCSMSISAPTCAHTTALTHPPASRAILHRHARARAGFCAHTHLPTCAYLHARLPTHTPRLPVSATSRAVVRPLAPVCATLREYMNAPWQLHILTAAHRNARVRSLSQPTDNHARF